MAIVLYYGSLLGNYKLYSFVLPNNGQYWVKSLIFAKPDKNAKGDKYSTDYRKPGGGGPPTRRMGGFRRGGGAPGPPPMAGGG